MLVAVIADTHLRAAGLLPAACVSHMAVSDLIVHAGDLVSEAALEELASLGPPVAAVCGNVDEPSLTMRLPERLELELDGARLGVVHDAATARGRMARLRRLFPVVAASSSGTRTSPCTSPSPAFRSSIPAARPRGGASRGTPWELLRVAAGRLDFELLAVD